MVDKTDYRKIAKMLTKSLPVKDSEYGDKVNQYLEVIKAMSKANKNALKMAYIFSTKAPREEREDLFQELALNIIKAQIGDERLAYAAARCDWLNWWKKYKIRQHTHLESIVDSNGRKIEYGELLVGDCEFENRLNGEMDAESLYRQLPSWIKTIVDKRLIGKSITGGERLMLNKWVAAQPTILASYVN